MVVADLTNGSIVLRPWRDDDAAWYVDHISDPDIQQFTSEPADLTVQQAEAAIRKAMDDPIRLSWAMVQADTGELLGNAGVDLSNGEVCYWVAAEARGRGVATAAVELMTAHAFSVSDRSALYLWIRPNNVASARVAVKASFARAPELDRPISADGESVMATFYKLTRDEWCHRGDRRPNTC